MKKLILYTGVLMALLLSTGNFAQAQHKKISSQGQGAIIGGAGGAVVGGIVGHGVGGALIGGAIGAGGRQIGQPADSYMHSRRWNSQERAGEGQHPEGQRSAASCCVDSRVRSRFHRRGAVGDSSGQQLRAIYVQPRSAPGVPSAPRRQHG